MPLTQEDVDLQRRQLIARLRLRFFTDAEIAKELAKLVEQDPDNYLLRTACLTPDGLQLSTYTIAKDILYLEELWLQQSMVDTTEMKSHILAEIREVRRSAWKQNDLRLVLQSIKQECELMGLDAPTKIDIEHEVRSMARDAGLDEEAAVAEVRRMLKV